MSVPEVTLADFCEQWYGYVLTIVAKKVDDWDLARDLTQEVFLKVTRGWDSWTYRGCTRARWLRKIIDNVIIDHWRHQARTVKTLPFPEEAVTYGEEEECSRPHSAAEMDLVTPESVLLKRHDWQATLELLGNLNERQRLTLFCRFLLRFNLIETSEQIKATVAATKALEHRACEALQVGLTEGDLRWIDSN